MSQPKRNAVRHQATQTAPALTFSTGRGRQVSAAATKEGGRIPTNEEKDADALQQVAAAFGSAPEMK
eukprot:symbB.v1.2.004032.t1/scaffold228.1/size260974/1